MLVQKGERYVKCCYQINRIFIAIHQEYRFVELKVNENFDKSNFKISRAIFSVIINVE